MLHSNLNAIVTAVVSLYFSFKNRQPSGNLGNLKDELQLKRTLNKIDRGSLDFAWLPATALFDANAS
jgi:hypothetical protein